MESLITVNSGQQPRPRQEKILVTFMAKFLKPFCEQSPEINCQAARLQTKTLHLRSSLRQRRLRTELSTKLPNRKFNWPNLTKTFSMSFYPHTSTHSSNMLISTTLIYSARIMFIRQVPLKYDKPGTHTKRCTVYEMEFIFCQKNTSKGVILRKHVFSV